MTSSYELPVTCVPRGRPASGVPGPGSFLVRWHLVAVPPSPAELQLLASDSRGPAGAVGVTSPFSFSPTTPLPPLRGPDLQAASSGKPSLQPGRTDSPAFPIFWPGSIVIWGRFSQRARPGQGPLPSRGSGLVEGPLRRGEGRKLAGTASRHLLQLTGGRRRWGGPSQCQRSLVKCGAGRQGIAPWPLRTPTRWVQMGTVEWPGPFRRSGVGVSIPSTQCSTHGNSMQPSSRSREMR